MFLVEHDSMIIYIHVNSCIFLLVFSVTLQMSSSDKTGLQEYDRDGRIARALEFKIGIKVIRHRECSFLVKV